MLVLPCNDLPEGNQSGSINKNSEQSDDSNTLSKLGEVRHSHFQNKVLSAVLFNLVIQLLLYSNEQNVFKDPNNKFCLME